MQLIKGIYQVSGCMFAVHQNVYAIDAGEEIVLIDPGFGKKDYLSILKNLAYWGLENKPITTVLLTHAHCEHAGLAFRFERMGAVVYGHPLCAEAVATGNDRMARYSFIDVPPFEACTKVKSLEDDEILQVGGIKFRVIYAPGHSDDSIIYELKMNDSRVWFTGDTILNDKLCAESMVGWTGAVDYNQDIYISTLARLSVMQTDIILPGHGEICLIEGSRMLVGAYLRARLLLSTQPGIQLANENMFR